MPIARLVLRPLRRSFAPCRRIWDIKSSRNTQVIPNSDFTFYQDLFSTTVGYPNDLTVKWSGWATNQGYEGTSVSFDVPEQSGMDNMASYDQESEQTIAKLKAGRVAAFHANAILGAALGIYEQAYRGLEGNSDLRLAASTTKSGNQWISYNRTYHDIGPNTQLSVTAQAQAWNTGMDQFSPIYSLSVGTGAEASWPASWRRNRKSLLVVRPREPGRTSRLNQAEMQNRSDKSPRH